MKLIFVGPIMKKSVATKKKLRISYMILPKRSSTFAVYENTVSTEIKDIVSKKYILL